jgi:hypothetical protein
MQPNRQKVPASPAGSFADCLQLLILAPSVQKQFHHDEEVARNQWNIILQECQNFWGMKSPNQ